MSATAFASAIYQAMEPEQLDRAIGKLERLVRSLDRAGSTRIAEGYREALDLALAERERRRV
jgi:hypothetical protein